MLDRSNQIEVWKMPSRLGKAGKSGVNQLVSAMELTTQSVTFRATTSVLCMGITMSKLARVLSLFLSLGDSHTLSSKSSFIDGVL